MSSGPINGYIGMLVAMFIWSLVMAIGFELARKERLYDYRLFLKALLGRGWVVFELVFIATLVLTTAVVGSASGELLHEIFSVPKIVGTLIMIGMVGFLVFKGSNLIEKVLSAWSMTLYVAYLILIIAAFTEYGNSIISKISLSDFDGSGFKGGFEYAAYNLAALPAILFVTRHFDNRREAVMAGIIAGPLTMIPAFFIYTAMLGTYPGILSEAIPAYFVINQIDWPIFQVFFQFVLFGTFIETGTGMIHGFNERIAGVYRERNQKMPARLRLIIAIVILVVAIFLAETLGLIRLIAEGYGYITWAYWVVFLAPLLILGTWKVFRSPSE